MPGNIQRRIILHIDMDSFFASVEVREKPELKGSPVIIGADPKLGAGRGVVSTCSYEARKYGVHSAMPVSKAYRLCPGAIFLPVNMPLYKQVSANVMEIIRSYSDKFEQVSIDEAYLDISGARSFAAAKETAQEIKNRIFREEGITCSAGISPSKVVSKIASDFKKPDGLTVVEPGSVASFLNPLDINRIPGIGKKTGETLKKAGIATVGDLLDYDIQRLISLIGRRHAVDIRRLASGADRRRVEQRSKQKSIGREITYENDTDNREIVFETVKAICGDLKEKISGHKTPYRTVTVKIRYSGYITQTKSASLRHYTKDPDLVQSLALKLISKNLNEKMPVRLIGVSVSNFESADSIQTRILDFF